MAPNGYWRSHRNRQAGSELPPLPPPAISEIPTQEVRSSKIHRPSGRKKRICLSAHPLLQTDDLLRTPFPLLPTPSRSLLVSAGGLSDRNMSDLRSAKKMADPHCDSGLSFAPLAKASRNGRTTDPLLKSRYEKKCSQPSADCQVFFSTRCRTGPLRHTSPSDGQDTHRNWFPMTTFSYALTTDIHWGSFSVSFTST